MSFRDMVYASTAVLIWFTTMAFWLFGPSSIVTKIGLLLGAAGAGVSIVYCWTDPRR